MLLTVVFAPKISGKRSELCLANRLRNRIISFVDAVSNAVYRRLLHPFQNCSLKFHQQHFGAGVKTRTENVLVFLYALFCLCFLEKRFNVFLFSPTKLGRVGAIRAII